MQMCGGMDMAVVGFLPHLANELNEVVSSFGYSRSFAMLHFMLYSPSVQRPNLFFFAFLLFFLHF